MLWTLEGLWLLLGLGVGIGASFTLFLTETTNRGWKTFVFASGITMFIGAMWLIADWSGSAGGGGL